MVLKGMFLYIIRMCFYIDGDSQNINSSLIGWHKMSVTEEWVICCHMGCIYEIGMRIQFSKQYRYITIQFPLYVTNYYISSAVTLLLPIMCLKLVNANIF